MPKTTFTSLAQEADLLIKAEYDRLATRESRIETRASELAALEATLSDREGGIVRQEKSLQAREEEVERKLAVVRRDEESQRDLDGAVANRLTAEKLAKEAQTARDEAKMLLDELSKRELALSEREASYREEVKQQIATKMLGI